MEKSSFTKKLQNYIKINCSLTGLFSLQNNFKNAHQNTIFETHGLNPLRKKKITNILLFKSNNHQLLQWT